MEPKSGSAVSLVAPTAPKEALSADVADPGQVARAIAEQIQTQTGKYGETPIEPYRPPASPEEKGTRTSWIEIELVDEAGGPVPGEKYSIKLPDGRTETGTLDGKGFARVAPIDPGTCEVSFPELDKDAWKKA